MQAGQKCKPVTRRPRRSDCAARQMRAGRICHTCHLGHEAAADDGRDGLRSPLSGTRGAWQQFVLHHGRPGFASRECRLNEEAKR